MGQKDPRIDAYIQKAAAFAQPILKRLRAAVHQGCPEVTETIKWGMPSFEYKGILCGMAAFKAHCTFGFWRGDVQKALGLEDKVKEAMGQFGCIRSLSDLPSTAALARQVREAKRIHDSGPAPARGTAAKKRTPLIVPPELVAAFKKHRKARETFERMSYGHQKEYVEWIAEAKRAETRAKRVATTIEWLTEGKSRNWKYESC